MCLNDDNILYPYYMYLVSMVGPWAPHWHKVVPQAVFCNMKFDCRWYWIFVALPELLDLPQGWWQMVGWVGFFFFFLLCGDTQQFWNEVHHVVRLVQRCSISASISTASKPKDSSDVAELCHSPWQPCGVASVCMVISWYDCYDSTLIEIESDTLF